MDISVKSTGFLIDELLTTLIRCWWAQEMVMSSNNIEEVAKAAKTAQETNARRSALIRAIDQRLGEGQISSFIKTYDHEEIKSRFDIAKTDSSNKEYISQISSIRDAVNVQAMKESGYKVGLNSNGFYLDFPNAVRCGFSFNSEMEAWRWCWDNVYGK